MKIRWIGQSGYVIETETTKIIIDPYLSDVVNRVAGRERMVQAPISPKDVYADAILCTHNHLDHLDVDAIREMDKTLCFVSTQEGARELKKLGCQNTKSCSVGDMLTVGDIRCHFVYAKHTTEAFGVVIEADQKVLYFSGDTEYDERLFEIAGFKPDVAFLCINGKLGNMNVEEAVCVAKKIGARINVPNHYGMFASNTEEPEKFTSRIRNGFIMEFNKEYDGDTILKSYDEKGV